MKDIGGLRTRYAADWKRKDGLSLTVETWVEEPEVVRYSLKTRVCLLNCALPPVDFLFMPP